MTDSLIRVRLGEQDYDLPSTGINDESATVGYGRPIHEIRLNEVEYAPLNEQGKQLLMELSPYESLGSVNLACAFMSVTGNTETVRQVVDSARGWSPKSLIENLDFYCPLKVRVEDGDNLEEGDPFILVEHEDLISDALKEAVPPGDNVARYMSRCSQTLQDKVASAVWDVGKIYGQVYGVIRCELYAPLTADEKTELAEWIRSQNFDGFGEGFEQTPIDTPESDIYVSFGNDDQGYFVYDFEQFTAYMNAPAMTPEPEQITFYCPLAVSCYDDDDEQEVELGNNFLVWHEEEIRTALRAEMSDGENMADYLEPPLSDKVSSAEWDIEVVNGTAYGKITCELCEPLDMDKQTELAEWISGQNSDGLGEGFEQRPVKTSDGELFVHLWEWNDDYFVLPEKEFRARILDQPLVVRENEAPSAEPQKPNCPLIGQDGNVFNLIGIAARTLRQNGLADQAKEMSERAFGSGSYDQALGVIMDYVNVTSVEDDMEDDEDEDWCREPEYDEDDWPEEEQSFGGMGGMA